MTDGAVAIVTSPLGVLIGRRVDGVPPWTFPGRKVEPGQLAGPDLLAPRPVESSTATVGAGTEFVVHDL